MTWLHKENAYMNGKTGMSERKTIALIAHDNKKRGLLEWAKFNLDVLRRHKICATGTMGALLAGELGLE
jgi:methylglyoxal synthase